MRSLNLFDTALCLMVYRQRLERLGTEFLAFLTRSSDGSSGARNTITTSQRGWNYSKLHRHIPHLRKARETMFKYGSSDSEKEKLSKVCSWTIIILGVQASFSKTIVNIFYSTIEIGMLSEYSLALSNQCGERNQQNIVIYASLFMANGDDGGWEVSH